MEINLTFSDATPQELVLDKSYEVYTNCPMSTLDKKLCGDNWHLSYSQLQPSSFITLPAGTYRITPLMNKACSNEGCWVCAKPLEQCPELEVRGIQSDWS